MTDDGNMDPRVKGKIERKHRQERGMGKLSAAFSEVVAMVDNHGHLNDAEFTQALKASLNRKMELMDDVHLMALLVQAAEFSPQYSVGPTQ